MKVTLLLCACFALVGTQLMGCGDGGDSVELDSTAVADGPSESEHPTPSDVGGAAPVDDNDEGDAAARCAALDEEPASCGKMSIGLSANGSSCRLQPTMNDLTGSPRSVRFDCTQLARGANGYDFDASGHLTLMGDTCEALQAGGSHRVTVILSCEPGTSRP